MKNTSIGERIKELRLKKGLTQKAFGEFINISYGHISNIEKGKDIPSDRILELICYKFNVSEDWLKLGEGSLDDRPLYTKVSKLTLDEKKALQNIFNINDFNDDHLYLTKIIIEMLNKQNIQKNSRIYYLEKLKELLINIDNYFKVASQSTDYEIGEITPYKSFQKGMEENIIQRLQDTVKAFFFDELDDTVNNE